MRCDTRGRLGDTGGKKVAIWERVIHNNHRKSRNTGYMSSRLQSPSREFEHISLISDLFQAVANICKLVGTPNLVIYYFGSLESPDLSWPAGD